MKPSPKDKLNQKDQEKYLQLQMMSQQIKATQEQLISLDKQEQQLIDTLETLEVFKQSQINSEILTPVATGIFAKAELKNNTNLIVNVGANTAVEMNIEHTKELIFTQIEEVKKVHEQLSGDLQKLGTEAHKLEHEVHGTECHH
ncbi:prefoldin subunit alpha [Candidatus Woesearchaeota archaeon]|nr:prefoldin subunit alpha [Candidatus Woesearchaeota archaeon]